MIASTDHALRRLAPGLLAVALAVLLMGCAQDPPPAVEPAVEATQPLSPEPASTDEAAPVAEQARAGSALPADAVTVVPLAGCSGDQVTTVRWNESAFVSGPISIWIDGEPRGLFAQAAEPGEKQTSAWAVPGMIFVVTDAEQRELARVPVTSAADCD